MSNSHDHNFHASNEKQERSDQEPHKLGSDDNVPMLEDPKDVPDGEDSVNGIPSTSGLYGKQASKRKCLTQKQGKGCAIV